MAGDGSLHPAPRSPPASASQHPLQPGPWCLIAGPCAGGIWCPRSTQLGITQSGLCKQELSLDPCPGGLHLSPEVPIGLCRPPQGSHLLGVEVRGVSATEASPLPDNHGTPGRFAHSGGHRACCSLWVPGQAVFSLFNGSSGLRGRTIPGRKAADSKGTEQGHGPWDQATLVLES